MGTPGYVIVVDVETTGLSAGRHSIVSIGAVDFSYPANQFYKECKPFDGADIDPSALAVNGFKLEHFSDPERPALFDVMQDFLSWSRACEDQTLAGMNTWFDRDFIQSAIGRYHLDWPFGQRIVDLHSVCYSHMVAQGRKIPSEGKHTRLSNDRILTYLGLPEEPKPHHGLTGARMESEAFSRLLHHRPLLQEFETYPLPAWAGDPGSQRMLF
jgi:DNA polymerase-3 subunit epsilon